MFSRAQGAYSRGFTLIEVMIALMLSGLVVLLAHQIFTGVVTGTERLGEARTSLDRDANARRSLTEMFGSLDVGTEGAGGFAGRPERVEFTTWQRVASGWLERRRVTLAAHGGRFGAWSDV
ncbi:MAG TPA: prepilin-type N-terminal cleavage/methylation domain-containing protein, partial [Gemmatimonadales bacterium]|nr:prepilin-type N-terminal cleavage/methylation domain-containing protein [Gemmatimonadales bacterium]